MHLFGQPVDMPALITLCNKKNLLIVEDCAQSFGAHIDNKMTGSFADFGAFSFFSATYFAILGAPDVAFTEAAVGAAITTVFFVSAISWTGRE